MITLHSFVPVNLERFRQDLLFHPVDQLLRLWIRLGQGALHLFGLCIRMHLLQRIVVQRAWADQPNGSQPLRLPGAPMRSASGVEGPGGITDLGQRAACGMHTFIAPNFLTR
mmetsp:Transcript_49014/g.129377  ORF Transcript_49014/g.129377 Transcript_49014/m.129377 type:complete len:112 (+) Transcript_49014:776-1111(+)